MSASRIALIGAGQFGSRHLQGLALCKQPLDLFLVDPSIRSREIAQERFENIDGFKRHQIQYLSDSDSLPEFMDVVIVATSAFYRRQVIESLLLNSQISHLVLEKVLFQSASDCREMSVLFEKYPMHVWVNATRRMWRMFSEMKKALNGRNVLQLSFSTAGWGMACNAYHMLDLFSWLADSSITELSTKYIDSDPVPARRDGFYEVTGMLTGRLASGACFSITDHRSGSLPFKLLIETETSCFMVQEGKAEVVILDGTDPEIENLTGISQQFQSNLTNELVESLLDTGTCALPTYRDAAKIHEIMLTSFAEVFNRKGIGEGGVCPIT